MTDSGANEEATPGETAPRAHSAPADIPPAPPLPPVAEAPAPQPAPPYAVPQPAVTPYGVPQYGAPPSSTDQHPTLPYESPAPPQRYGPPQGYGPPPGYAPPAQGYPPQGYGYAPPEGYSPPAQGYGPYVSAPRPATPRGGAALGIVALSLAVVATVGATILGSIAAFSIGLGTGRDLVLNPADVDFDWSLLTPVRGWVLLGELAFWAGTILGIWSLVQGIVAIVKDRGRGWGIAAVVVAVMGPIAFGIAVQGFLAAGFASGASLGG